MSGQERWEVWKSQTVEYVNYVQSADHNRNLFMIQYINPT